MYARGYTVGLAGDATLRGRWNHDIPGLFAANVLGVQALAAEPLRDPHCLGVMKDFRSLAGMAEEARKPVFMLGPSDGALGSHAAAVQQAFMDYEQRAGRVAAATWRRPGSTA